MSPAVENASGPGIGFSRPSGIKSIFSTKLHKRTQSTNDAASGYTLDKQTPVALNCLLPNDHPHSRPQRPLGERGLNLGAGSKPKPDRSTEDKGKEVGRGLHKKTKSSVSLKSLLGDRDKKEPKDSPSDEQPNQSKPKKTKSSTSLSALFKRSNRGRKENAAGKERDKENTAPIAAGENMPPPIWPQFDSDSRRESMSSEYYGRSKRTLDEEMSLYTPRGYSPSKQRNFHDYQPSLTKRPDTKARPKSDLISSNPFLIRDRLGSGNQQRRSSKEQNRIAAERTSSRTPSAEYQRGQQQASSESNMKRASKVLSAISLFAAKEKRSDVPNRLDSKEVDAAFEELLDSRNIPHNMRDKMRSLGTTIKADFIAKHQVESTATAPSDSVKKHRRGWSSQSRNTNIRDIFASGPEANVTDKKEPKSRPGSGVFNLSKNGSPRKESRPESVYSHQRQRSTDMPPPAAKGPVKPDETTDPSDFVHYLKEVQKPELVEVGKLHKLRILLRNETVAWVEAFISCGGMDQVVDLIYRTIKVEWREEHEDSLLHEALLCLKALCTTSPALRKLCDIESVLFPTLLQALFSEDKKGPSEFTTRGIIISLLFVHLSAASRDELPARARTILAYLRDPSVPEESQPLSFIANIYQDRPYRVWSREVSNVTKEVFWIFLHHLNVVPVNRSTDIAAEVTAPFVEKYYPPPHAPVPAAPYIGGVEWDATNYLANHVDLINGLIASLPTIEERCRLRTDLRASGFEKVMGRSLRTCKEKLYPAIHEGLRIWVAAAAEDRWDYQFVREGPPRDAPESNPSSPIKGGGGAPGSPKKRPGIVSEAPPKLNLNVGFSAKQGIDDNWI